MLYFSAFPGILVGGRRIQGSLRSLAAARPGDLISRFISSVAQNYSSQKCKEDDRRRLESILLRVHSVIEEADGRHITNQRMLLQLKGLVEGFYLGYYMLDKIKFQPTGEESSEDEVSHDIQSFALSTCNSAKRFRFTDAIRKRTPVVFGRRSTTSLKDVDGLETKISHMREFVMLLGSHPRLPRHPYITYLFMDNCMFGRRIEKEQVMNFLLCKDPHDPYISILPIIGPQRMGKKILAQEEPSRVNCFQALVSMEILISAVAGDLISRFISTVTQNYRNHTRKEEDRWRLEHILLRMHSVVEEAERRHITNQGMLMQLKGLIEGFYLGYYMLDKINFQPREEEGIEDEVSHEIQSFALSACNSVKRFRFAGAIRKRTPVAFGSKSTRNLKDVVDGLETKIADMREFVILLGSHPRLPRQPYSTYLYIENCMFGRPIEKQQVINFLLHNDSHDPCVSILPIIGPPRIGKKTLVQHACLDERVRNYFSHIFFFQEDDLKIGELSLNSKASQGKYLFVFEFIWDVDEAAWTKFQSYLQNMPGTEIKVVVIGTTEDILKFGTTQPIRLKRLSEEEYWYYFKALAFGSMDPDEHPKLASLAMQLATELRGGFLGANLLGGLLRANPNTQFWQRSLLFVREVAQKHLSSSGVHPEDLLERNIPVDFSRIAFVDGQVQGCLVYDLRVAGPAEGQLPKLTSRDMLLGGDIPVEDKFDALLWRSHIPPYCNYIATFEKRKPRRMVGRKRKYKHKYYFD